MSDDLTNLRAAAEGWAPLPWRIDGADIRDANDGAVAVGVDVPESALDYLVAAANAAPGLAAEVERLRGLLREACAIGESPGRVEDLPDWNRIRREGGLTDGE